MWQVRSPQKMVGRNFQSEETNTLPVDERTRMRNIQEIRDEPDIPE